jgi:hypothetical protein
VLLASLSVVCSGMSQQLEVHQWAACSSTRLLGLLLEVMRELRVGI